VSVQRPWCFLACRRIIPVSGSVFPQHLFLHLSVTFPLLTDKSHWIKVHPSDLLLTGFHL
jgi:hypothetical protein